MKLSTHEVEQVKRVVRFAAYTVGTAVLTYVVGVHGAVTGAGLLGVVTAAGETVYHQAFAPLLADELHNLEHDAVAPGVIVEPVAPAAAAVPPAPTPATFQPPAPPQP